MLVSYKNATICQQNGSTVLDHVDFKVDESEFVYLIGRVGSGKSSLLKTIYFELDIDEADEAVVLGKNLKSLRRKDIPALRRQMGIIFQDFQLLHDRSVWRNLQFVLRATGWKKKAEIDERITAVLKQVDMLEGKSKMPHELSGGEQQRIAIARALLNEPRVILADEPTGNLDPETARNIVTLLHEICQKGTAVVMTTHNQQLIKDFPGIVYRFKDHEIRNVSTEFYDDDPTNDVDLGLEDDDDKAPAAEHAATEQMPTI